MKNWQFHLGQFFARTYMRVDGFFFKIRLSYLQARYGKDLKNLPSHIRLLGDMPEGTVKLLIYASTLKEICDHYRIDPIESQLGVMYRKHLAGLNDGPDEFQTLMSIAHAETPALDTYLYMLESGEITLTKKNFFGPPPPFGSTEEWLAAIDQKQKV